MKILKDIKHFFDSRKHAEELGEKIIYAIRAERLNAKTMESEDLGISPQKYGENELIVSLTTFGKRVTSVSTTIESIMQGTLKPNRIVLWLDDSFKNSTLPIALQKQIHRGLEISYCKDIKSYKKIIPTLKKYPDATIITIDDDVIYDHDLVENFLREHNQHPRDVIANRIHEIVIGRNGKPLSYNKWKWTKINNGISRLNFSTGIGGVLYPPHCLDDEVFNEEVFFDICKYADDVWLFAMEVKKGTMVRKSNSRNSKGENYVRNFDVQDVGLFEKNVDDRACRNDKQFAAVFDKYNLYDKLTNI